VVGVLVVVAVEAVVVVVVVVGVGVVIVVVVVVVPSVSSGASILTSNSGLFLLPAVVKKLKIDFLGLASS